MSNLYGTLHKARLTKGLTQAQLAERLQSSQPRIAKAEGGDQSVSIELLMRAILATGATPQAIGKIIASVDVRTPLN